MGNKFETRASYYKGLSDKELIKEMQNFRLIVNRNEKPSRKKDTLTVYYGLGMEECERRGLDPFDDAYLVEDRKLLGEVLGSLSDELRSRILILSVLSWEERTNSAKYKIVFADGWYHQQGGGAKSKLHKTLTLSNEKAIASVVKSLKKR